MASYPVIEQRTGRRPARWLRANRLKIALVLSLAETLAVLLTDATWRWALVLAALVFAFHILVGRKARNETVRALSWTLAGSQLLPVLVPVVAYFVALVAVVVVVVLALVVAAMLLLNRR